MNWYLILADVIVALHFAYVAFVLFGQLAILIGWPLGWRWIRNPWFRIIHLILIMIVVVESLPGIEYECPLTTWEVALREAGGQPNRREGGFIARYIHGIMFFPNNNHELEAIYCLFGVMVLVTLFLCRPRFRRIPAAPPEPQTASSPEPPTISGMASGVVPRDNPSGSLGSTAR